MNIKSVFETAFKIIVVACLCVLLLFQFSKKEKIVYVDAVKLMNEYKGMIAARQELDSKTSLWSANLDTLGHELELKIKEYQTGQKKLTAKEKALMEELIESKKEQYENYQNIVKEKVQKEDQQLTASVLGKVNDFIKNYGEEHGYQIIMAATQYGNIVYAKEGLDITDEVLNGLNKGSGN
jgi:outer membrane protein